MCRAVDLLCTPDGSAVVHTVTDEQEPWLYGLLRAWSQLSVLPFLLASSVPSVSVLNTELLAGFLKAGAHYVMVEDQLFWNR